MFDILGIWFIVFLTLSIFSYLYGDNPFYKIAEHIFVGVSAGYIFTITFWDTIWPNLLGRLFPDYINAGFEFDISYVIPLFLGLFMLFRLSKKYAWLSRISLAYILFAFASWAPWPSCACCEQASAADESCALAVSARASAAEAAAA